MSFLNYDSPFMVGFRKLVDYMLLGMLWLIACIPVITFGASTTAAIQTAEFSIRRDEGKMSRNFWTRFRREFKQATLLWLLELPLLLILLIDIYMIWGSTLPGILQGLIGVATVVVFCWVQLWFGYLSKFQDTIRTLLGNTFRMMLSSFIRVLLMAVLAVVTVVGIGLCLILMPPLLMIVPGAYLMVYTALLRKLFAKFLPEEEKEAEPVEA